MFGRKAKEIARRFKETEPKVDDVKVDAVDTGESFREKTDRVDEPKTRGEAFKAARANRQKQFEWPPGSGNMYHTRTAEEEKKRNPASTASKSPAPKMSRVGTTPSGEAIRQTVMPKQTGADMKRKHDELVAKERQRMQANRAAMAAPRKPPMAPMSAADRSRMGGLEDSLARARSNREAIAKPGDWLGDIARRNYAMSPEQEEQTSGELTFLRNKYNMPAMAKGGSVESKAMIKKEIGFMQKKGAPKSMIKHEKAEAKGMKCGGMAKYAMGGTVKVPPKPYVPTAGDLNEKAGGDQEMENRSQSRGAGRGPMSRNAMKPKMYARGGGIESHGKTKGSMVKMASGGSVSARADGVATKGKTNCKIC